MTHKVFQMDQIKPSEDLGEKKVRVKLFSKLLELQLTIPDSLSHHKAVFGVSQMEQGSCLFKCTRCLRSEGKFTEVNNICAVTQAFLSSRQHGSLKHRTATVCLYLELLPHPPYFPKMGRETQGRNSER